MKVLIYEPCPPDCTITKRHEHISSPDFAELCTYGCGLPRHHLEQCREKIPND